MGVLDTTYTFTATDVVTSVKLNNVIDQTTFTSSAVATGNATLAVVNGQLKVNTGGITANELANNSVTATQIANNSVTAAKLSGSQSGSAPIFGARAYGTFNGQVGVGLITPTKAGNIASITRNSVGTYTVVMATAMEVGGYCVVANANHYSGNSYAVNCSVGLVTATTFVITLGYLLPSSSGLYDSPNISFVVFQ